MIESEERKFKKAIDEMYNAVLSITRGIKSAKEASDLAVLGYYKRPQDMKEKIHKLAHEFFSSYTEEKVDEFLRPLQNYGNGLKECLENYELKKKIAELEQQLGKKR